MFHRFALTLGLTAIVLMAGSPAVEAQAAETPDQTRPVRVVATVPDLGDLAREVGGDDVEVTTLARGGDDPHFLEARPSFIRHTRDAELFIQIGMEFEAAWASLVVRQSANPRVQPGRPGFVDASRAITPRGVPEGPVDRSMGDVHAEGNPHYLLDPLAGLAVAALIRDRLIAARPDRADAFNRRFDGFRQRMGEAMVGSTLAQTYDFTQLATLHEHDRLHEFLENQGQLDELGGWLAQVMPYRGTEAIGDHNLWPYFAARFDVDIVGFLEPTPGMPPTTRHLRELIEQMREQEVRLLLIAPYFDRRHAQFVARHTLASIVPMAHQVGSRPGTETYLDMIDYNVRQLIASIE